MNLRLTAELHELVFAMDAYAGRVLALRFGTDHNHFLFLSPLADGPLDITRLAERLNLTKAAVSKRVPQLAAEGWLTATPDPQHGRRVELALSPKGRALVSDAGRLLGERFLRLAASVSIDPAALAAQLRTLTVAVRQLDAADTA